MTLMIWRRKVLVITHGNAGRGAGVNFSHQIEGASTAGVQVVHCTKHLAGVQMEAEIQPSSTRQARESGVRLWMPKKELFSNLC